MSDNRKEEKGVLVMRRINNYLLSITLCLPTKGLTRAFRALIISFLPIAIVLLTLGNHVLSNEPRLLLIGSPDNLTYLALTRLGYQPVVVEPTEQALRQLNPLDYQVIISGIDVRRDIILSSGLAERLVKAIEDGRVFVGFRNRDRQDNWLPAAVKADVTGFLPDNILADHPILNEPHRLDMAAIRRVHGGIMYFAFAELGSGWIPILSGDKEAFGAKPWFQGEHHGLIELPYGRGRIILCQLIPEYNWAIDDKWSDSSAGKLLLENIMHYALKSAMVLEIVL